MRGLLVDIDSGLRRSIPAAQLLVQQHAGAGAALAIDVAQPGTAQVSSAVEPRVGGHRDQEAVVAVHQPDHGHLAVAYHTIEL